MQFLYIVRGDEEVQRFLWLHSINMSSVMSKDGNLHIHKCQTRQNQQEFEKMEVIECNPRVSTSCQCQTPRSVRLRTRLQYEVFVQHRW